MKTHLTVVNNNIFGLNLLRFAAVVLVVMSHFYLFSSSSPAIVNQLASVFGFLGIEILLVLSGYLLGMNMLNRLVGITERKGTLVLSYLKSRTWRVLPLYYLFLTIVFVVALCVGFPVTDSWKSWLFFQNFSTPIPSFFPESWPITVGFFASIALILSLAIMVAKFSPKKHSMLFLMITIFFMLLSFCLRIRFYTLSPNTTLQIWDQQLKSVVIYRLDSFFIGVLFSWICFHRNLWWGRIKYWFAGFALMLFFFLFVGVGYFGWHIEDQTFFWDVLYLPLTSLASALLLPLFSQLHSTGFVALFASVGRRISYSLFLIHYSVLMVIAEHLFNISTLKFSVYFLVSLLYLGVACFVSFLFYHFFEKPLIDKGRNF